jgi:hypothetical protein
MKLLHATVYALWDSFPTVVYDKSLMIGLYIVSSLLNTMSCRCSHLFIKNRSVYHMNNMRGAVTNKQITSSLISTRCSPASDSENEH